MLVNLVSCERDECKKMEITLNVIEEDKSYLAFEGLVTSNKFIEILNIEGRLSSMNHVKSVS